MAVSLLLWPLAGNVAWLALVHRPWALGCFAAQLGAAGAAGHRGAGAGAGADGAQHSAIYLGQAVGA